MLTETLGLIHTHIYIYAELHYPVLEHRAHYRDITCMFNLARLHGEIMSYIEIGLNSCSYSSNINITSFASIDLLCYGNIGTHQYLITLNADPLHNLF